MPKLITAVVSFYTENDPTEEEVRHMLLVPFSSRIYPHWWRQNGWRHPDFYPSLQAQSGEPHLYRIKRLVMRNVEHGEIVS